MSNTSNCELGLSIDEKVFDANKKLYKKQEYQWLSLKLEGKDFSNVVLEKTGADGVDYQQFLDNAFPSDGARYNILRFEYDLGLDGKRTKTVLISWCPHGVKVKERMIFASSKRSLKHSLGLNQAIEIAADDRGDIAREDVLDKCKRISR